MDDDGLIAAELAAGGRRRGFTIRWPAAASRRPTTRASTTWRSWPRSSTGPPGAAAPRRTARSWRASPTARSWPTGWRWRRAAGRPWSPPRAACPRRRGPNGELRGRTLSLEETAARWGAIDHCPPGPDATRATEGSRRVTSAAGAGGARVAAWTILGGGHTWPGSPPSRNGTSRAPRSSTPRRRSAASPHPCSPRRPRGACDARAARRRAVVRRVSGGGCRRGRWWPGRGGGRGRRGARCAGCRCGRRPGGR